MFWNETSVEVYVQRNLWEADPGGLGILATCHLPFLLWVADLIVSVGKDSVHSWFSFPDAPRFALPL